MIQHLDEVAFKMATLVAFFRTDEKSVKGTKFNKIK